MKPARVVLFGTAIVLVVNPLIMLIYTALDLSLGTQVDTPPTMYFLHGYFPCIAAGVFIARTTTPHRLAICALVGLAGLGVQQVMSFSHQDIFPSDQFTSTFPDLILFLINDAAMYVLLIAGACAIAFRLSKEFRKEEDSMSKAL